MRAISTIVAFILVGFIVSPGIAQNPKEKEPREPHPLAPSLPQLTKEEYQRYKKIVDDFILYDIGQLKGAAGLKALQDFNNLGPEATLVLIEGLNEAANMKSSCPAVIIGKKLGRLLRGTRDRDLLDYTRTTVGIGVTAQRHMGVIRDLKVACITRKSYLQRNNIPQPRYGEKEPGKMAVTELVKATDSAKGSRLMQLLTELESRKGDKVLSTLGSAMNHKDKKVKALAQNLLLKHLYRQPKDVLKQQLKNEMPEVRGVAAYIVGYKSLPWGNDLIGMLDDYSPLVRQGARGGLIRLSRGQDFGPQPGSSETQRQQAIRRWQAWWNKSGR